MLALAWLAAHVAWGGEPAAPTGAETIAAVEELLSVPLAEMPAEDIEPFLAVDPRALPARLRLPFEARRLELRTLRHLTTTRRRGTARSPAEDCSIPTDAKSERVAVLKAAGYQELSGREFDYIARNTKCSQRQLMCEFSLAVVVEKVGPKETRERYFIHPRDPLMAMVAEFRSHGRRRNTDFFGTGGFPSCSKG